MHTKIMSLQITRVKGIPIKLHFTLIIVFVLVSWTLASGTMPRYFPNLYPPSYWVMGISVPLSYFFQFYCMNYSFDTIFKIWDYRRQIILFIFGGI